MISRPDLHTPADTDRLSPTSRNANNIVKTEDVKNTQIKTTQQDQSSVSTNIGALMI